MTNRINILQIKLVLTIFLTLAVSTIIHATDGAEEWKKDIPEGAITETPPIVYGTIGNTGGLFIGTNLNLGQSSSSRSGSNASFAALFSFELGYSHPITSWTRFDVGVKALSGFTSFTHRKVDGGEVTVSLPIGMMLKAGYGYKIGNGVFGLLYLGAGGTLSKYEYKGTNKGTSSSKARLIYQIGFDTNLEINKNIDVKAGFNWTRMAIPSFTPSDVQDAEGFSVNTNIYLIEFGVKYKLI